jgi:beta-phosphoglucomutase-like phosphatase (HAD superfamily)
VTKGRAGVLVDCDGTLLDTNYLHAIAWSRALRELDEWAPMNAIHRLVGMGGDQLVPELLGHDVDGADQAHDRHYAAFKGDICAFSEAGAFLRKMHDSGLVVVLASSASEDDLADMRRVLDADDAIDETVNADDVQRSKPDPEIFDTARDKAGIDPSLVLAVGDSVWDVRAARAAGMGCVGVESGGFSRHELSEAGAVAVYRDVEELGEQLLTSPIGGLITSVHRTNEG